MQTRTLFVAAIAFALGGFITLVVVSSLSTPGQGFQSLRQENEQLRQTIKSLEKARAELHSPPAGGSPSAEQQGSQDPFGNSGPVSRPSETADGDPDDLFGEPARSLRLIRSLQNQSPTY